MPPAVTDLQKKKAVMRTRLHVLVRWYVSLIDIAYQQTLSPLGLTLRHTSEALPEDILQRPYLKTCLRSLTLRHT
jgi:hypothetical protein